MRAKTGIIMLNMGGPEQSHESTKFLRNLFFDEDIISVPFPPFISGIRGKTLKEKYDKIGGGSPIHKWTHKQGENMCKILNKTSPDSAPHKYYVGFRYVPPFFKDAIESAIEDKVERLVLFSQYPQYSCTTSGSSFNEAACLFHKIGQNYNIPTSLIDRWFDHPSYIKAWVKLLKHSVKHEHVPIVFTAHSIPFSVVSRGDWYPSEIFSTVEAVMRQSKLSNPYYVAWQSKVGFAKWMEPSTKEVVSSLIQRGMGSDGILLVPIAFTTDHIETLYDIDISLTEEIKKLHNYTKLIRIPSLNDDTDWIQSLAQIVKDHIDIRQKFSSKFLRRCPLCTNERCANSKKVFSNVCS